MSIGLGSVVLILRITFLSLSLSLSLSSCLSLSLSFSLSLSVSLCLCLSLCPNSYGRVESEKQKRSQVLLEEGPERPPDLSELKLIIRSSLIVIDRTVKVLVV